MTTLFFSCCFSPHQHYTRHGEVLVFVKMTENVWETGFHIKKISPVKLYYPTFSQAAHHHRTRNIIFFGTEEQIIAGKYGEYWLDKNIGVLEY